MFFFTDCGVLKRGTVHFSLENNNIAKKQQQNKRALIFLNFFPHSNANSILNILYIVYYVLIFHYNQVYMTTPDYKALHGETNYVLLIN